ncbi:MAG: hypothetical protein OXG74_13725 [Acidobacteria bacterium]|nr:hypothetical protein [Acidobacteriota bacterium]
MPTINYRTVNERETALRGLRRYLAAPSSNRFLQTPAEVMGR